MKCLILAGGSGDALWPLSRRNYPKQFININKGRSLFQEAIARNLPFCDEFFIVTNYKYENIVKGQLHAFQGLNYHLFLEEIGRQTAPAVAIPCMCMAPEEEVLVVSTDHMITGGDYNGAILAARQKLTDGCVVALGCQGEAAEGHNYFDLYADGQVDYVSADMETSGVCDAGLGGSLPDGDFARLLDSGIFLVKAGTYLKAVNQNKPALYEACCCGRNRMHMEGSSAVMTKEWLMTIPSVSVGALLYEKWCQSGRVKVVVCNFGWSRLLNLETVAGILGEGCDEQDIQYRCDGVSIINEAREKLVVANNLQDVLIVNTKDAVYVSGKGHSAEIKRIISGTDTAAAVECHKKEDIVEKNRRIFDEGDIFYTTWGCKETLSRSEGYQVKKLTIFPGNSLSLHKHEKRSEHWSVVSGTATILLDGKEREYKRNESIFVPMGVFHRISNETAKDLIVIEVSIGESVGSLTEDMVSAVTEKKITEIEEIVKLSPVCKDFLWGGRRLESLYGMELEGNCIAESWELSAHPAGCNLLAEGNCKGESFDAYLKKIGREALGWKCQPYERFPMLVKFIDADKKLSIQVHPEDAYALSVENDYGKNEVWYILEAAEDAFIYLGFERDTTEEECRRRIAEGTLAEILHKVPVKAGDSIFIPAGTVHAINEGVLALEIQQSSNATYRLYDYNRPDKDGKPRQLHLEKAFLNMDFKANTQQGQPLGKWQQHKGYEKQLLEQCKYFSVFAYKVENEVELVMDDSTFYSIVFINGKGTIETPAKSLDFRGGDSFFLPAGRKVVRISGSCHFVLSHV